MDELLKNIYAGADDAPGGNDADKTVYELWQDFEDGPWQNNLVDGGNARDQQVPGSLEDFLFGAKTPADAAAGTEPEATVGHQLVANVSFIQPQGGSGVAAGPGEGRGKRKAQVQEEPPVDKATQKKQRLMMMKRESAARSRQRQKAYTAKLEAEVAQLEEEHARLLKKQAELKKKKSAETEGNRPQRTLRRTRSM